MIRDLKCSFRSVKWGWVINESLSCNFFYLKKRFVLLLSNDSDAKGWYGLQGDASPFEGKRYLADLETTTIIKIPPPLLVHIIYNMKNHISR